MRFLQTGSRKLSSRVARYFFLSLRLGGGKRTEEMDMFTQRDRAATGPQKTCNIEHPKSNAEHRTARKEMPRFELVAFVCCMSTSNCVSRVSGKGDGSSP